MCGMCKKQRKVLFAGLAGVVYAHSKQSMIVMEVAAKEREKKTERDRVVSEAASAKAQLTAANSLLDKYRAKFGDIEPKKEESAASASQASVFTYSSLASGEVVEKFATSYDAGEKSEAYNSDTANDVVVQAESRQ